MNPSSLRRKLELKILDKSTALLPDNFLPHPLNIRCFLILNLFIVGNYSNSLLIVIPVLPRSSSGFTKVSKNLLYSLAGAVET
jgi:hypothetical protein